MASLYKIFSEDGSLVRATKDFCKNKSILVNAFRGKNYIHFSKTANIEKKITVTLEELRELNDMFSDRNDIAVELDETVITEFCII